MSKTKKISGKELAETHVFPSRLSPAEKKSEENAFSRLRIQRIKNMTEEERHFSRIMQLKYMMEDYASSNDYNEQFTFSYFLNEYLHSLNKNKTVFSKEISLHSAQLSRLLNNKDGPSEKIMVRLEIHSSNIISATDWHRVYEKQKEWALTKNKKIRKEESKHVSNKFVYEGM
jgi:hypothetical protein